MVPSSKGVLDITGGLQGEVTLPSGASNATVRIVGPGGAEVKTIELGKQSSFAWDGLNADGSRAAAGVYQIKAEAMIDGKTTALETQASAPVISVSLNGAKGIEVDTGALGKFAMSDIQQIL
jgi:flagellar basal-body rod modification protein FlgD